MTTRAPKKTEGSAELLRSLEPVRRALLADAAEEVERMAAESSAQAAARVAEVEGEITEALERAERRGRAVGRAQASARLAEATAAAHHRVLVAADEVWDRLVDAARAAAIGLRDDERYDDLRARLVELAREQLGEEARIEDDDVAGGIVAVDPAGRRVDYTLPALADRALDRLGDRVAELWR